MAASKNVLPSVSRDWIYIDMSQYFSSRNSAWNYSQRTFHTWEKWAVFCGFKLFLMIYFECCSVRVIFHTASKWTATYQESIVVQHWHRYYIVIECVISFFISDCWIKWWIVIQSTMPQTLSQFVSILCQMLIKVFYGLCISNFHGL